jgi:signal peptide peptidase SppA
MEQPWCINPGGYAAVKALVDSRLAREGPLILGSDSAFQNQSVGLKPGRLATITISGTLGQRLSDIEQICGGCDYQSISGAITDALAEGAEGILFVIDSPGGMATGCGECAQAIADVPVPTVAFTDSMMCSAAYWLASSCQKLIATNSADVGSIGVLMPWVDQTRLWDQLGIRYDPIVSSGDTLKTTGGGPSLNLEQRQFLQAQVDQTAADFRGFVSNYRSVNYTELKAGWYSGSKALDLNLIDKIGSQSDALNELAKRVSKAQQVDKKR